MLFLWFLTFYDYAPIFHRLVFDRQNTFLTLKIQKAYTLFMFDIMYKPLLIT